MSRHDEMLALTRRALEHYRNGTTDQAPAVMHNPVSAYVDEARYQRERERIFRGLPLALALSLEVPNPGDYRAMTVLETPVLIVRGKDGTVRAFVNACRHRGARLCEPGAGHARVFTCPYHAWAYDDCGRLVSRYAADTFGDVDHATLGLTELPCAERIGLVYVLLTPGATMDIDAWLGDFAAELAHLRLGEWHIFAQRELDGPGWKVALDGYLEAYHHNSLHGRTVGKYTVGNLLVLDTWGPHQRLTFGRKSLGDLLEQPEAEWSADQHIRLIHNCFPNTSVSGILGDHCLVSQIFPGPTATSTITRQTVLVAKKPETAEAIAASELFSALVLQAVQDEDYKVGQTIQDALAASRGQDFLYGRNEPAVQNYHRTIARLMAAHDADDARGQGGDSGVAQPVASAG